MKTFLVLQTCGCVIENAFLTHGPEQNRLKATNLDLANMEDKTLIKHYMHTVWFTLCSLSSHGNQKEKVLPTIVFISAIDPVAITVLYSQRAFPLWFHHQIFLWNLTHVANWCMAGSTSLFGPFFPCSPSCIWSLLTPYSQSFWIPTAFTWASLVASLEVKNLPAMQETWV